MSSSALSIAVSALRAQTYAVETTSHNVANAATPGYRRQRVELKTAFPRAGALGPMGAGVEAARISRATDRLADLRVRGSSATASYFGTRSELLKKVEDLFGEPDQGVTKELTATWDAFATLAVSPSDNAARYQVISALQGVADRVNEISTGLGQLSSDSAQRLASDVDEANSTIARLGEINKFARMPGGLPADLADERDRALDSLATSIGAQSSIDDDGRVRVTLNGLAVVDGDRAVMLAVSPSGAVTHPSGPITLGGTVGGLQASVTTDIADAKSQLDSFVNGFMTALNTIHATGFTPSGAPGGPLLAMVSGKLTVTATQPGDLAAADVSGQLQNGRIADALAQLRTTQGGAYRTVITALSGKVAGIGRSADTASSVADAASQSRDSEMGVNLDEEMTDLMSHQRAYQAAAKLVSVVDEMMQTLIQM
jgi:flagellar hook-associated protein 1 FlgK